jgi:hypothetical protein
VARSLSAFASRYPDVRFLQSDLQLLTLTIQELTLMRRVEEFGRELNRTKARELREQLERVRERKEEAIAETERYNTLMRSGSPRGRKGIIAC